MREFRPYPKTGAKPKKEKKPLKRTPIKKKHTPKGEKNVFEDVLNGLGDTPAECFVCGTPIALITHCNFAHVLRKGSFPKYRLYAKNVKILCYKIDGSGCHTKFDFSPRSELKDPMWQPLFELEAELKKQYPKTT